MCETPSIVMMGDSYSRSAWACAQTMRCHRHESETVPHSLSMAAGARRTSRERPLRSRVVWQPGILEHPGPGFFCPLVVGQEEDGSILCAQPMRGRSFRS
jgi:hypothetical protein